MVVVVLAVWDMEDLAAEKTAETEKMEQMVMVVVAGLGMFTIIAVEAKQTIVTEIPAKVVPAVSPSVCT